VPLRTAEYVQLASFRTALRGFLRFSELQAGRVGLSSAQYQALLAVRASGKGGGLTINHLARQLLIKHNSAVGLVDRLVEHGLLRRETVAQDARKVQLRLTRRGRQVLRRLAALHRAELRRVGPALKRFLAELSRPA
jgi:DNA-binding MarR family transcriptional regulator